MDSSFLSVKQIIFNFQIKNSWLFKWCLYLSLYISFLKNQSKICDLQFIFERPMIRQKSFYCVMSMSQLFRIELSSM